MTFVDRLCYIHVWSRTSDSGVFEISTQYNKPPQRTWLKGHENLDHSLNRIYSGIMWTDSSMYTVYSVVEVQCTLHVCSVEEVHCTLHVCSVEEVHCTLHVCSVVEVQCTLYVAWKRFIVHCVWCSRGSMYTVCGVVEVQCTLCVV